MKTVNGDTFGLTGIRSPNPLVGFRLTLENEVPGARVLIIIKDPTGREVMAEGINTLALCPINEDDRFVNLPMIMRKGLCTFHDGIYHVSAQIQAADQTGKAVIMKWALDEKQAVEVNTLMRGGSVTPPSQALGTRAEPQALKVQNDRTEADWKVVLSAIEAREDLITRLSNEKERALADKAALALQLQKHEAARDNNVALNESLTAEVERLQRDLAEQQREFAEQQRTVETLRLQKETDDAAFAALTEQARKYNERFART